MPTVLAKKYRLPKPQTDREIMTVCPVCWRGCQAFLVANTRKVDGAKTGLQFGEDDPVRSDFLRRWHIDGIHICDVCKRPVKTCAARKARHARRIEEQEREVADAQQYVTDELLNAWKSAEGEEKKRLQKEGNDAERRFRVAERRLAKMKDRGPCRPPKLKKLPTWWTNEVLLAPKSIERIVTTRECESVAPTVAPVARPATGVPSAAYCDGGVIGSNPSPVGGTWAVVLLAGDGEPCLTTSGVVTPDALGPGWTGTPVITNNYTELLAAVEAMERLPAGWSGTLHTDSNVTRCRIVNLHPSMAGIPESLQQRLKAAKARLGWMPGEDHVTLLNGHPTKAELAAGVGKRGLPTSKWNVLCDKMCGDEAKRFVAAESK